jgi:TorA maturation chaperone TorD
MTALASELRKACQLLGGLALEGAQPELLCELRHSGLAGDLGRSVGGELGAALEAMQQALGREDAEALAAEYTRLMVASADGGGRRPLPVPPWEDCYRGGERRVLGPRSQAALRAYAAAELGFDGMKEQPADHLGLELCFVAALLAEEERGERDDSARRAFLSDHLASFSPAIGHALASAARADFWREMGRAVVQLPAPLVRLSGVARGGPS